MRGEGSALDDLNRRVWDAVAITVTLVRDAGFDPVVVGPLARAKEFDRDTPVYVTGMTAREIRETLGLR